MYVVRILFIAFELLKKKNIAWFKGSVYPYDQKRTFKQLRHHLPDTYRLLKQTN